MDKVIKESKTKIFIDWLKSLATNDKSLASERTYNFDEKELEGIQNITDTKRIDEVVKDELPRFVRGYESKEKDELAHVKNAESSEKQLKQPKLKQPNEKQYYK